MTSGWFESAGTFRRCTAEKASFVVLCVFDLVLTVFSTYLGFAELNPFVRFLIQAPLLLLFVKLFIPLLIAWFMPGKLLLPSIALLALIVIWNIKELVVFLV
jgi:antibiotic biosynthesis monooxygenase (ABM) superfamily enzyme